MNIKRHSSNFYRKKVFFLDCLCQAKCHLQKNAKTYLKRQLQDCDAIVMLCDNSLEEWANEQIYYDMKIQVLEKTIALFNKSPEEELFLEAFR